MTGSIRFRFSPRRLFRNVCAMTLLPQELVLKLVRTALAEDVGSGDATTLSTVPEEATSQAKMVAREPLVVCGGQFAEAAFLELNPATRVSRLVPDGAH